MENLKVLQSLSLNGTDEKILTTYIHVLDPAEVDFAGLWNSIFDGLLQLNGQGIVLESRKVQWQSDLLVTKMQE